MLSLCFYFNYRAQKPFPFKYRDEGKEKLQQNKRRENKQEKKNRVTDISTGTGIDCLRGKS